MSLLSATAPRRSCHLSHPRFLRKYLPFFTQPSSPHHTRTFFLPSQNDSFQSPKVPKLMYQWQEGVEDLECYRPGGYHPTHIGDQHLDGRYEVVHKLGYGSYSTVWLARDHLKTRSVALKILVAAAFEKSSESKVLRVLGSGKPDHQGRAYVSSLLDEFIINGPNGRHLCIVSEAAGCSVAQSKEASTTWMFPANVARAISAQVLLGLDYIHSCDVVHSGRSKLSSPSPGIIAKALMIKKQTYIQTTSYSNFQVLKGVPSRSSTAAWESPRGCQWSG